MGASEAGQTLSKKEMQDRAKAAKVKKPAKTRAPAKAAAKAPAQPAAPQTRKLSEAEEKRANEKKTLEAVTKLIQENNVSPQDAMEHAKLLKDVKVRKKGDAQRILLMNMVKLGNISLEDAMMHAEAFGMTDNAEATQAAAPPPPKQE